jgi:two-component system OmpR family response regulator
LTASLAAEWLSQGFVRSYAKDWRSKQVNESEGNSIGKSGPNQLGRKILVIDDEVDLRRFIKLRLSRAGYKVFDASNGIEGLEQLYKVKPHLVILDIMMPKMDGWETCRRIREISDIPILILSAKGDRGSQVKGLDLGANDYLAKPFAGFELLKKIEALLSNSDSSPSESI